MQIFNLATQVPFKYQRLIRLYPLDFAIISLFLGCFLV